MSEVLWAINVNVIQKFKPSNDKMTVLNRTQITNKSGRLLVTVIEAGGGGGGGGGGGVGVHMPY